MESAGAEQSHDPDDDEVDRDDVVEQSRHHQDEDAGDQRDEGREHEMDMEIHGYSPRGELGVRIPETSRKMSNFCSSPGNEHPIPSALHANAGKSRLNPFAVEEVPGGAGGSRRQDEAPPAVFGIDIVEDASFAA